MGTAGPVPQGGFLGRCRHRGSLREAGRRVEDRHAPVLPEFRGPYQGGWAAVKAGAAGWTSDVVKTFPSDAPAATAYQPYPAVFVAPYHYAGGDMAALRSRPPVNAPKRPDDALGRLEALADAK